MSDQRPDPDVLLASLNREEQRSRRGKLKVFFGMCPGVGKTFAMLRSAQQELRDGVEASMIAADPSMEPILRKLKEAREKELANGAPRPAK